MSSGLSATNPTLEAAFKSALLSQGTLAFLIFVLLAIAWVACREVLMARARSGLVTRLAAARAARSPEPAARRVLRISFGVLWIFDGLLQAQPAMPGGLPSQVIEPAAQGSPGWVLHLVSWAATTWTYHPVQAATAAVWIQLGIGIWLAVTGSPRWSRLAGLVSVGWGLVVWVFGEAFGSMLVPGLSWLTGAPGGALFYCTAGLLLALPVASWQGPRLGRRVLRACGALMIAFAVLQAWPGRGFWQGSVHGRPGSLTSMISGMAATPQPAPLHALLSGFARFTGGHGFAVNLFVVAAMTVIGGGLLTGRPAVARLAAFAAIALCLADWVLVQDLGFLGGVGTDPNSMLPQAVVVAAGLLALSRGPAAVPAPAAAAVPAARLPSVPAARLPSVPAAAGASGAGARRDRFAPGPAVLRIGVAIGSASTSAVLTVWAAAIVLLGAAPMALATADRTADPIIATALDGTPQALSGRAPAFALTDQDGRGVSLPSLRGKVILLTFLDPVCTGGCPPIAGEFRAADQLLGGQATKVELVAIPDSALWYSLADIRAFDRQEQLAGVPNWLFLTGSLAQLTAVWRHYSATARTKGPGAAVLQPDVAYVINARGDAVAEINLRPGSREASPASAFAAELAQAAQRAMRSS